MTPTPGIRRVIQIYLSDGSNPWRKTTILAAATSTLENQSRLATWMTTKTGGASVESMKFRLGRPKARAMSAAEMTKPSLEPGRRLESLTLGIPGTPPRNSI